MYFSKKNKNNNKQNACLGNIQRYIKRVLNRQGYKQKEYNKTLYTHTSWLSIASIILTG
jgi:hypothetical protein